ncbi:unnamed protein product [Oncorhynchus mykiss]|uniref:Kinesin-like protein n=1 Tax=Oncorhynchus mykiss TaxID=8022 RepID=A0A060XIB7_ONCMY|nr:unnamed protein product [Oncorhynchus mykiss]
MVVLMDPMEDPDDILRANRSREKTYMFDVAFDYSANQEEVYRATTKGLIEGLISGYNATVFAYGPTGCGKTYTMLGTDREPGIYVRTLNDLFKAIEETSDDMQYNISMSYLEIYNEMIRDLLNPSSGFLDLREDSKGEIQVAGITEVSTINAREIMELLMKGNKQRTQEPTAANQTSSRSHAVLQVAVRQTSRCRDLLQEVRFARLFMIDLAGSERASQVQKYVCLCVCACMRACVCVCVCVCMHLSANMPVSVSFFHLLLCHVLQQYIGTLFFVTLSTPSPLLISPGANWRTYKASSLRKTTVWKHLLSIYFVSLVYLSVFFILAVAYKRTKRVCVCLQQTITLLSSTATNTAEVQAHSTQASRAEMDQLREQLLEAFRSQMEIRRSLMELDNSNMEIQMDTSKHLLTIADWEQERSRRRRKWRAERRKESFSKEESEKDSDCPESPPDSTETQEVAMARENLVTLMAEQKKIRKQKASLESHFVELRERARRLEELLPRRVSCEEQREVLGLLCKVHELEIENAKMQSHALLKDNVIRQKNFVVQRFEQHRHLCDEIIQQQRQFINDHSLLVPPHLQELYGMYMRELDERNLDRAMALDKVTGCTLKEASLPKISLPSRGRGLLQDVDSDQESVRTMGSETRHGRAKARRHTLPPILPEAEG